MGRFGPTLTYCVGKIHHFSVSKPNKLIKFPKLSNIGLWLKHGGSNRPTTLDINGLSPSISVNAFLIHRNPILMYDLGNFSALCCDFVTDSSVDSQVPGAPDFFFGLLFITDAHPARTMAIYKLYVRPKFQGISPQFISPKQWYYRTSILAID